MTSHVQFFLNTIPRFLIIDPKGTVTATQTVISSVIVGFSHLVKYPISMLCAHLIKTNVLHISGINSLQKASCSLMSQCNKEDYKSMYLVAYATGMNSKLEYRQLPPGHWNSLTPQRDELVIVQLKDHFSGISPPSKYFFKR